MARADVIVGDTVSAHNNGGATNYLVQTPSGVLYQIINDNGSDVAFRKSSDGGFTWGDETIVYTGVVTALSIWYDKWSDLAGGLIHCAYQESGTDDTLYRTIDTASSDALSTQTTIFAGVDTASGGCLSITRSRGGNVYCYTVIDAGAEGGFYKLLNANVPNGAWEAVLAGPEALATTDQMILVPGFAADNQDIMGIFWDASANRISRYIYDDSGNTWAETEFGAPMTFTDNAASNGFPHFSAAVDLTNSQILVAAWNAVDTPNADLTCWTVTESAITAKTNVVTDSTDDQGLCAISLDTTTGYWWVFYGGKSDGSETFATALKLYYQSSTDSGSTWSGETLLSVTAAQELRGLYPIPRVLSAVTTPPPCSRWVGSGTVKTLVINVNLPTAGGGGISARKIGSTLI